jgi:Cu/Ag efflux pump CusA
VASALNNVVKPQRELVSDIGYTVDFVTEATLTLAMTHAASPVQSHFQLRTSKHAQSLCWKTVLPALRSKMMMMVVAIMAGLLPIVWGTGTGSEFMSRIAAPMVVGMISSTVLTLAVIPAIYALVKQWRLGRELEGRVPCVIWVMRR